MGLEGRRMVVAGGAVGRMAAALLLARAGASVTVLERVAEPAAVGAGLLLQPNGLAVLAGRRRPRPRAGHPPQPPQRAAPGRRPGGPPGGRAAARHRGHLAGLRAAWAAALPLAGRVLERVKDTGELLVNQVVRVDCERWHDGRLVLVGDAAHAMAPTLGQGANSALVDAAVLAIELAGDGPPEQALARYGARRRPAVRRVQDTADRLARLAEVTSPPLRRARDTLLRAASGLGSDRRVRATQQEDPARLRSAVAGLGRPG